MSDDGDTNRTGVSVDRSATGTRYEDRIFEPEVSIRVDNIAPGDQFDVLDLLEDAVRSVRRQVGATAPAE